MDSAEAEVLAGTEGVGAQPFWSPDSRFIAFFADGKLKKLDVSRGPPQTLCDAPAVLGGSWNRDGVILFGSETGGIQRVSAAGGVAQRVTTLDSGRQETSHRWPSFLPDGRRFLYLVQPGNVTFLGSLDSADTVQLVTADSFATHATPGYLLYLRQGTLMAHAFDAARGELTGEAVPVADEVRSGPNGGAAFSVSETGTLVYAGGAPATAQAVWFDGGWRLASVGQAAPYRQIRLSPDARRAVTVQSTLVGRAADLWLLDLGSGILSRLTFADSRDEDPVWSPDSQEVAFVSDAKGPLNLYRRPANGGDETALFESPDPKYLEDWSADGAFIIYRHTNTRTMYALPLSGDRKPMLLLDSPFATDEVRFSPDGGWISYQSDESSNRNPCRVVPRDENEAAGVEWWRCPGSLATRRPGVVLFGARWHADVGRCQGQRKLDRDPCAETAVQDAHPH